MMNTRRAIGLMFLAVAPLNAGCACWHYGPGWWRPCGPCGAMAAPAYSAPPAASLAAPVYSGEPVGMPYHGGPAVGGPACHGCGSSPGEPGRFPGAVPSVVPPPPGFGGPPTGFPAYSGPTFTNPMPLMPGPGVEQLHPPTQMNR